MATQVLYYNFFRVIFLWQFSIVLHATLAQWQQTVAKMNGEQINLFSLQFQRKLILYSNRRMSTLIN